MNDRLDLQIVIACYDIASIYHPQKRVYAMLGTRDLVYSIELQFRLDSNVRHGISSIIQHHPSNLHNCRLCLMNAILVEELHDLRYWLLPCLQRGISLQAIYSLNSSRKRLMESNLATLVPSTKLAWLGWAPLDPPAARANFLGSR